MHRRIPWREWRPCAANDVSLTLETSEHMRIIPCDLQWIVHNPEQPPKKMRRVKRRGRLDCGLSLPADRCPRVLLYCSLLSIPRFFPMALCVSIIALFASFQLLRPELQGLYIMALDDILSLKSSLDHTTPLHP